MSMSIEMKVDGSDVHRQMDAIFDNANARLQEFEIQARSRVQQTISTLRVAADAIALFSILSQQTVEADFLARSISLLGMIRQLQLTIAVSTIEGNLAYSSLLVGVLALALQFEAFQKSEQNRAQQAFERLNDESLDRILDNIDY